MYQLLYRMRGTRSFVVVFLCCIGLVAVRGKYKPICQPTSAKNAAMSPKLPDIPSAFSTSVEGNFVNKNYTAIFKEYYDFAANKGTLERTEGGKTNRAIYNYDEDERMLVNIDSLNCSVLPIDQLRNHCKFSFFGNNNSRIETVADLFRFTGSKKESYSYVGTTSVRGVKCNHWRSCYARNFSSFYVDYYFSIPGWGTSWQSANSTVVRAVVNGTSQNKACNMNGTWKVTNGTHDFYHVYDFFDFRAGRPDPSYFQLPEGYYCTGLKGPNKTVPIIPPVFSMEIEGVLNLQSRVENWQEVYDLEKKLVMFKGSNWWHPNLGPIVQIHDFNTGIGYKMSTPSERNQHGCRIFNLTDKNWDATDAGNHYIRMKTTQELFRNPVKNSTATIVYKGVSAVRGIAADVWVSKGMSCHLDRNNKSYECVVEWYFSKPSWNLSSGFAVAQHQVPLKMVIYSQHGKASINVFNFDAEPVQPTVFDIKPCFSPDQQVFIQFTLKGGKYDYVRWRNFMLAVTQSISSAAGVSLIRVNGMRLSFEGQGNIIVTFILLGKPAFKAQSVEQPLSEKALKDALNALKNAVESGKFKMKFNNEILQAERSSFFHGYKGTPSASPVIPTEKPSDKPQPGGGGSSNKKGVPGGAVAGVAFVMLAVGILGGLGIAHVIMKRRGTSLFQYQRHE